mmetsp:Transcript_45970/g.106906  ORF Transcript_45970/g.106906 Transcript_45970/m.106906 type:complete len:424 (-) Transcript_45970:52-1323(-)
MEGGQQKQITFAGVFLSGADKVDQSKSRTDGILLERSHDPESMGLHLQSTAKRPSQVSFAENGNEFIKDPPCVMPFVDLDEMDCMQTQHATIQAYWKGFAGYLDDWPSLRRNKAVLGDFLTQYENLPADSKCRGFVCMSQHPVAVRSSASFSEAAMTSRRIEPGDVILVQKVDQASEEDSAADFLELAGGQGWVFSMLNGQTLFAEMRMLEAGALWYRVVCSELAEVRAAPLHADWARTGWILNPGECVSVALRAHVCGYDFLMLADGRGWIFMTKPTAPKNTREPDRFVMAECETDFLLDDIAQLQVLVPATNDVVDIGKWTYVVNQNPVLAIGTMECGVWLVPGDVVRVNKRAIAHGGTTTMSAVRSRRWLRLADHRGWVPETFEDGREALTMREDEDMSYPQWYQSAARQQGEEWMSGRV